MHQIGKKLSSQNEAHATVTSQEKQHLCTDLIRCRQKNKQKWINELYFAQFVLYAEWKPTHSSPPRIPNLTSPLILASQPCKSQLACPLGCFVLFFCQYLKHYSTTLLCSDALFCHLSPFLTNFLCFCFVFLI